MGYGNLPRSPRKLRRHLHLRFAASFQDLWFAWGKGPFTFVPPSDEGTVNKQNVRKWVEALRSGDFKQTTGQLYVDGSYCCLGVACAISGVSISSEHFNSVLPDAVMEWLGVEDSDPEIGERRATQWNDSEGKTFEDIARLIEKEWLGDELPSPRVSSMCEYVTRHKAA